MEYRVSIYEKAFPETVSIDRMLFLAKKYNYDSFELNIDRTDYRINRLFDDRFSEDLQKAMNYSGVSIESVGVSALSTYTLGNVERKNREKGVEILKSSILFSYNHGIKIIQIPLCDVPKGEQSTETSQQLFLDNLSELINVAAKYGIILALENMETSQNGKICHCLQIVDRIHSPFLQIYPDVGNLTNAFSGDYKRMKDDIVMAESHLVAIHLKEVTPKRYGGLFYGDGIVDFDRLVKQAYICGVRRFGIEYWYTGNNEWEQDLDSARKMIDNILMKVKNG